MDEIRLGSRTLQPRRQLLVNGRREPLGKRALDILSVLAGARGAIVTKDELLEAVWPGVIVEENALQVHIVALRKALGPEADRLKTIRGVGYQLDVDPEPAMPVQQAGEEISIRLDADATRGQAPTPRAASPSTVPPADSSPRSRLDVALAGVRRHRWALVMVGLLVAIVGGWSLFGSELGLAPRERIPVVVRALSATEDTNQAEAALAGGITDELIDRLRRIPDLRIATAASDGSVAGDAFRNAYVVDGTIRSSNDRVRVTVRLSDAKGEVLWSDTLDRGMSDLFDLQEDIAAAIAGALSVSFEVGANSARYGGTDNPEAYAAYVAWWEHALDFDQSVPQRNLERAVALDPDFGKALSALTLFYGNAIITAQTDEQAADLLAKVDDASRRALSENSEFWFGPSVRGWYFLARHDYKSAERQMRRVAELDQGDDPELRDTLATYAIHMGRLQESIAIRESKQQIDPIFENDPWGIVFLLWSRRFDEAIARFEALSRYQDRNLQTFTFHVYFSYLLAGREADGEKFADDAGYPFAGALRAYRANKPSPTLSLQQLRNWRANWGGNTQIGALNAALFAAYDGEERLAVDLLRIAHERPDGFTLFLIWHPVLAEARRTDAFEQLVTDLGLVAAWRESGDWGDFCRPVSATEITCT